MLKSALPLIAWFGCVLHAESAWPQFRGADGQGHAESRNLPLQWGSEQNVAWKKPIPGKGWSSPVLQEGRIYLTTAVRSEGNGNVSLRGLCLEARSGQIVWDQEVFADSPQHGGLHNKNSHASPTPLLDSNRLYLHFGHRGTACLDLAGNILWTNTSVRYEPVHGSGGSPILVENALIFSCDGASNPFLVALDKKKGQILWKAERHSDAKKTFSFSTPLCIEVNGSRQVISPGSNVVSAYNPETGQEIWQVRYEGYSVVPRPVYGHGLVFISTGFDHPSVLAIRPDGRGDVTDTHVAWETNRGAPCTPSLLLVGDELYAVTDGGIASCLDARTGRVHWQERIGGNFSASPVYADGRIYLQSETGTGTVLRAGKDFQKLAKNELGENSLASYAVADGSLFIRTERSLFRISQLTQ